MVTEELFKNYSNNISLSEGHYEYLVDKSDFKEALKEFTKFHVQKALNEASEKASVVADDKQDFRFQSCNCLDYVIDKDSILNAYSLDNIK